MKTLGALPPSKINQQRHCPESYMSHTVCTCTKTEQRQAGQRQQWPTLASARIDCHSGRSVHCYHLQRLDTLKGLGALPSLTANPQKLCQQPYSVSYTARNLQQQEQHDHMLLVVKACISSSRHNQNCKA